MSTNRKTQRLGRWRDEPRQTRELTIREQRDLNAHLLLEAFGELCSPSEEEQAPPKRPLRVVNQRG
jgi:hypothetical protein